MTKVISCWMQSKMGAMQSGTYIALESDELVMPDDIFALEIDSKKRYFRAMQVEPERNNRKNNEENVNIFVTAIQCGYYDQLYKNTDIRKLRNMEAIKVTDSDELSKIRKESSYL